jgi:toxin-antitoxin system PIN domain toxin
MIVPDINLLLYASITGFAEHPHARRWWEEALNGEQEVGLAAPALFGFIRIATNPRVFTTPMSVEKAMACVQEWLERPQVRFLLPGPRHLEVAFRLLRELGTAGNLTTDVQLAALAIEYQGTLHSNDTDFGRFQGLRWVNPLRG